MADSGQGRPDAGPAASARESEAPPEPALSPGAAVPQRDTGDVDPRLVERQTEARADEILADAGVSHEGDPPDPAARTGRVDARAATLGRDETATPDDVTPS